MTEAPNAPNAGSLARLKRALPWWARVGAKMVLARLPVRYGWWKALGLFEHGAMNQADYVISVFRRHYEAAQPSPGFACLELGPGDSLASMLVSKAFGASAVYLVDAGDYASRNPEIYAAVDRRLDELGTRSGAPVSNFEQMLRWCNAQYQTEGLKSLQKLPSASLDLVWSQAVLEHVPRAEFLETLKEVRRVLRPSGVATHQVDLRDHLGGALNSLRFSDKVWEGRVMSQSGFYTNRIRFQEMLQLFDRAGFHVDVAQRDEWQSVPTARGRMAPQFRVLSDEDLRVASFFVVLRPK